MLKCYIEDGARSSRLKKISPATEQRLLNNIKIDRVDREKSNEVLIYKSRISRLNTLRILYNSGLLKVKSIKKNGFKRYLKSITACFLL
jgi:hypothetical protein